MSSPEKDPADLAQNAIEAAKDETASWVRLQTALEAGEQYVVGESGPEWFVPNQDGWIISSLGLPLTPETPAELVRRLRQRPSLRRRLVAFLRRVFRR